MYPSAAALLKFVNWCLEMVPQKNFMLVKFYFLANLRKKEEAAWLSCKLILLSLPWLLSSFPRGFAFWVTEPYTALCHCCIQHMGRRRCQQAVCQDGFFYFYFFSPEYPLGRCGSISGREYEKHICGQDHLLLTTSTFLQLAVSGVKQLPRIYRSPF